MNKASFDTNKTIFKVGSVDLSSGDYEHLYYDLADENTMYLFGDTATYEYFRNQKNPLGVSYSDVMQGRDNHRTNLLFKDIVQKGTNLQYLYPPKK